MVEMGGSEEEGDNEGIVEFRERAGLVERLAIWEERAESMDARGLWRRVGEGVSR